MLIAALTPMLIKIGETNLPSGSQEAEDGRPPHYVWVLPSKKKLGDLCESVVISGMFKALPEYKVLKDNVIDVMYQYKGDADTPVENGPIARFIWCEE